MINSTCSDSENELFNFENEDEKKLFMLTRLYTRINKNTNYDVYTVADKGEFFILKCLVHKEIYGSPYKHPIAKKGKIEKCNKNKKSLRVNFNEETYVRYF